MAILATSPVLEAENGTFFEVGKNDRMLCQDVVCEWFDVPDIDNIKIQLVLHDRPAKDRVQILNVCDNGPWCTIDMVWLTEITQCNDLYIAAARWLLRNLPEGCRRFYVECWVIE